MRLFVELPKLRAAAVRLQWCVADLYGLFFSRLLKADDSHAREAVGHLLESLGLEGVDTYGVLNRRWPLAVGTQAQRKVMTALAGRYMGPGAHAYKKGNTYDWPINRLADAFDEVTPRSFLGMLKAAAEHGAPPDNRVIVPEGIRHGLREASKTRVDQLHQEFPWIKGVLAPLAGLLLPQEQAAVCGVWRRAQTLRRLFEDAGRHGYLPPFPEEEGHDERQLFSALERIGVMFRCKDERLDTPDLFRVAARLLKTGAAAPAPAAR